MTTDARPRWSDYGLNELGQAIKEGQNELAGIFKAADNDVSKIPADEAVRIKQINDELTDMGVKYDELYSLNEAARTATGMVEKVSKDIYRPSFPDAEKEAKAKARKARPSSLGEAFVQSDAFTAYAERKQMNVPMTLSIEALHGNFEQKAVLGTDDALAGVDTEYEVQNIRLPGILGALEMPLTVADLMPQVRTSQQAIPYMYESAQTNAAAETNEAATKPESSLTFLEASSPVRKIATWLPVTEELFADVPAMRGYVNNRLRTFVLQREDNQLLNGDGIAPNLTGILNTGSILTQAKGADPTPDAVHKAITNIWTNSFFMPDATVWNPTDWQDVKLLRTADGIYIWGAPQAGGPDRIWGLPVVQTTRLAAGTALVGAFRESAMIFRREDVNLRVYDQHSDFAITNKLAIVAEERLALVVFRPTGFCTVTGV